MPIIFLFFIGMMDHFQAQRAYGLLPQGTISVGMLHCFDRIHAYNQKNRTPADYSTGVFYSYLRYAISIVDASCQLCQHLFQFFLHRVDVLMLDDEWRYETHRVVLRCDQDDPLLEQHLPDDLPSRYGWGELETLN